MRISLLSTYFENVGDDLIVNIGRGVGDGEGRFFSASAHGSIRLAAACFHHHIMGQTFENPHALILQRRAIFVPKLTLCGTCCFGTGGIAVPQSSTLRDLWRSIRRKTIVSGLATIQNNSASPPSKPASAAARHGDNAVPGVTGRHFPAKRNITPAATVRGYPTSWMKELRSDSNWRCSSSLSRTACLAKKPCLPALALQKVQRAKSPGRGTFKRIAERGFGIVASGRCL